MGARGQARLAVPWVVIACVAVVGHALMPDGPWRDAVHVGTGAGAVVVTVTAIRRMTASDRVGWVLLACGLGLWVLGDLAWMILGEAAPPRSRWQPMCCA